MTVTVVVGRGELAALAAEELAGVGGPVHRVPTAAELATWSPPADAWVPLVVLVDDAGANSVDVDEVVRALDRVPALARARFLLVTTRSSLSDMSASVDAGRVDGVVAAPWTAGNLARYAEAQVHRAAHLFGRPAPGQRGDSALLRHLGTDPRTAAAELLEALESVLGPRPRVYVRAGVRIAGPDERLTQVFLVLRGRVALTVRSGAGEVVLHHASTGPLVGLMALTEMQDSAVTARTTTDCELVSLTLEQLDRALTLDPRVGTMLMALSVRALTRRLRRSEELHLQNALLSSQLREANEELRAARAGLVEQARLATLGELTAGIAHELNNPAATVTRGVDHLSADLRRLLGPDGERSPELQALVTAEERDHLPAREERALRRGLAEVVRDPATVRRLVAAGVRTPAEARRLLQGPPQALARVEAAAAIGSTLRGVRVAGHHIATLVSTLRTHARPGTPEDRLTEPTDVGATVQDALRLLEHRLRGLTVEVEIEPGLPLVPSGPGLLTQVWTNLLSNAADALAAEGEPGSRESGGSEPGRRESGGGGDHRQGHVTVRVEGVRTPDGSRAPAPVEGARTVDGSPAPAPVEGARTVCGSRVPARGAGPQEPGPTTAVRVRVEDDGPGVPDELRGQIFTPRFTTKHGVVRYGLGLGLGIASSIVARHGGRMSLDTVPGRTVFSVELPVHPGPLLGAEPTDPQEDR
ncbi:ATP-binding protein [Ornithinimicrobium flavum]|uniref:ATP-binding protein n=1 Tax=Ornithinimicrobium flavum TaxID=1288636 RepID=UPI00106F3F46|nr:ATP-binding protein [Ornithinimicrobium flavum]